MAMPDLVIFDCDGVLIDSEALCCRVDSDCLAEIGIDLPVEAIFERYVGISTTTMLADIAVRTGRALPAGFADTLRQRVRTAFEADLTAIDGVAAVLTGLTVPVCVASSSEPARLAHSLGLVGLWQRFAPHVFSATQVARGKPAPDLFLFAAAQMGHPPAGCVVIEDSLAGVQAARAAGMRVLGFTGGSHCGPHHATRLREAGADTAFARMCDLPALLEG
ncbi:MAG: HAD family hydrolase [Acetobacteraceae bacterium]|nr:HAD family hydrolase [Acetobacteraceae bacterium]